MAQCSNQLSDLNSLGPLSSHPAAAPSLQPTNIMAFVKKKKQPTSLTTVYTVSKTIDIQLPYSENKRFAVMGDVCKFQYVNDVGRTHYRSNLKLYVSKAHLRSIRLSGLNIQNILQTVPRTNKSLHKLSSLPKARLSQPQPVLNDKTWLTQLCETLVALLCNNHLICCVACIRLCIHIYFSESTMMEEHHTAPWLHLYYVCLYYIVYYPCAVPSINKDVT